MMPPKIPPFNAKLSRLTSYTTAYKKATQSEFLNYSNSYFPCATISTSPNISKARKISQTTTFLSLVTFNSNLSFS